MAQNKVYRHWSKQLKKESKMGCCVKSIVIDGEEYVRKADVSSELASVDGLQYCVVRCYRAGVHAGFVKERNGTEVTLLKTRRLWRWFSRGGALSGLSKYGTPDENKCKFSVEIEENTVLDACEVIPCTREAMDNIRNVKEWENDK